MPTATPYRGLPPFLFGMTPAQVLKIAGNPDGAKHDQWDETQETQTWHYPAMQVNVTFDRDLDWRLSSINISDPSTEINGIALIGCSVAALAELAVAAGVRDIRQTDDFEEYGQCFESDSQGLMLWALTGKIANITLFSEYQEDGNTPVWPDVRP